MQFTDQELAMIATLRRQRDAWPVLRMFIAAASLFLLAAAAWEFYSSSSEALPLILLLVGVMSASHTYRNWNGPPEASLILKLVELNGAGPNA